MAKTEGDLMDGLYVFLLCAGSFFLGALCCYVIVIDEANRIKSNAMDILEEAQEYRKETE